MPGVWDGWVSAMFGGCSSDVTWPSERLDPICLVLPSETHTDTQTSLISRETETSEKQGHFKVKQMVLQQRRSELNEWLVWRNFKRDRTCDLNTASASVCRNNIVCFSLSLISYASKTKARVQEKFSFCQEWALTLYCLYSGLTLTDDLTGSIISI